MSIFFSSDTHFGHDRDFIWKARGFESIEEMNNEIIKRWNNVVSSEDTVYLLGDVMLGDNEKGIEYLKQLNGKIYLAIGNHDTDARIKLYRQCSNVIEVQMGYRIKYKGKTIVLSHYPTIVDNGDDIKTLNFFGHTHQTQKYYDNKVNMYHVGMDSHNCCPIKLEDIMNDIMGEKD